MKPQTIRAFPATAPVFFPCEYFAWQIPEERLRSGMPPTLLVRFTCYKDPGRGEGFLEAVSQAPAAATASARDEQFLLLRQQAWERLLETYRIRRRFPSASNTIWRLLITSKIETIDHLFAMTDQAILALPNIGRKSLQHIRQVQNADPAWDEWAETLPGWRR